MRHRQAVFILSLLLPFFISSAWAQEKSAGDDFVIEFPSPVWRPVSRGEGLVSSTEFVYGDQSDGYLRVRKEIVEAGTTPSDLARRDREQNLRFRPGFVEGREERFAGRLNGIVTSYEFTQGGRPMAGIIYYLQADPRTIYVLHFTAVRDRLQRIRNQTDSIARSFQVK
jgi:hypothetical protein